MLSLPLLLIISDRVEESAVKNAKPNNTSIGRKKAALNTLDIKSVAIITIIKLTKIAGVIATNTLNILIIGGTI